ncbi:hypothetical protein LBMAG36_11400 [Chlorobiota bacterium]|nr:hypothetical protein LBMAG36_11400 [Chlorobiota bacterium]
MPKSAIGRLGIRVNAGGFGTAVPIFTIPANVNADPIKSLINSVPIDDNEIMMYPFLDIIFTYKLRQISVNQAKFRIIYL